MSKNLTIQGAAVHASVGLKFEQKTFDKIMAPIFPTSKFVLYTVYSSCSHVNNFFLTNNSLMIYFLQQLL